MSGDEQSIRELVATWMAATREGDVDTVLSLKWLLARDANLLA